MGTSVRYNSLEEANTALLNYASQLDDPISSYIEEVKTNIGPDGKAWSGTAAENVLPLLERLSKAEESIINVTKRIDSIYSLKKERNGI